MKYLALILAAAGLAACDARVEVPAPVEKNTTIVNPPAAEKKVENKTTIINPPAPAADVSVEKKTTTTTTQQ